MLGTQAPGAQVEALRFTVYDNSSRLDIGHPAAVGMALGVADIITKLSGFPA